MQVISSTAARQDFRNLLDQASQKPVAIERHGRTIAVLSPPGLAQQDPLLERRLARAEQARVEAERLIRHQAMGIRLLADPVAAAGLVASAGEVVDRWEREQLCSRDFIDRWREILSQPLHELVVWMCGDAEGWGAALRQNSPWSVVR